MKKLGRSILIIALVNMIINSGLILSLAGPVMDDNSIGIFDLITKSESRATFKDEIVKSSQEKALEMSSGFWEYVIDEISIDPNAKGFEGYSEDDYDFEARIKEKEEMDKLYDQLYPVNP